DDTPETVLSMPEYLPRIFIQCASAMETLDLEPRVLANGRGVVFALARLSGTVECVMTLAALQAYFWLEPQASEAQILKTFPDGYGRISVIAEGKLPAHPVAKLELTPDDFARP